ncbi:hypothetical protein STAPHY8AQ_90264 [Staphylococcus sp. 8AQ]|nr:hypothetical protein STAPHY8AQ_90264 [Staphylococcus sp. 8AQ]
MLTNDSTICKLCINNYKTKHFTHYKKESKTYTAYTENLHTLREDIERKFENGLGVLMPIRGINGFARYSDTVLTFC